MTERVRAEETRQKLEAQLLQSQKMEAIGQLAGGIAHDFNNLLTVIAGYTEVLLHALAPGDALSESVRSIREASDRASSLTRQLLMFSRQHPSESRVLDFNELVAASEKMLRRVIGEDILFTVSLDPTIGCIKADPAQLNQVLMNLVVNARDAMPRGGSLTVETHAINNVGVLLPGNTSLKSGILLKVSDTGTGMTPDVAARIFDPFFTTKGVGKGTGLGLAVVHGIVEQCGGRIEVNSAPGTGTTFQIFLPVYSESSLPQLAGESEPAPRGSETILLVEDDEAVRKLALLSLTGQGYRVLPAVDGQDALRIVNEHPQPIDMLLTDVVMPNMDGLELAQHLQARFPGMKILFVSGYSGRRRHATGHVAGGARAAPQTLYPRFAREKSKRAVGCISIMIRKNKRIMSITRPGTPGVASPRTAFRFIETAAIHRCFRFISICFAPATGTRGC